jgi:hypothetical protein
VPAQFPRPMSVRFLYRATDSNRAIRGSETKDIEAEETTILLPNVGDVVSYRLNTEELKIVYRLVEARTFLYLEDRVEVSITVTEVEAGGMRRRTNKY